VLPIAGGFLGQDPSVRGFLPRTQSSLVDATRDFAFNPEPIGQGVLDARDTANRLFGGNLEQTLAALQRSLPRAEELAETGFRTELPRAALDRQLNEQLAQFQEQFQGFRGGTDLFNIGSREITASDERRALAQAQLDEQAAGRKAAAQGLPGSLAALLTSLPSSLGQGLLGFDTSVRGALEEQAARPLSVFQALRGLVQPTGILQTGFPATDPTASSIGALAQAIPQLMSLFPQAGPQTPNPGGPGSAGNVGGLLLGGGLPSQNFGPIGGLSPAPAPNFGGGAAGPQVSGNRLGIPQFFGV
jgi:hypothetical protein